MFRIGQGFDVHEFAEGRPLIIGGITIPHEKGLIGHSDADVLLHTIADACLGAIAAGDIGKHFLIQTPPLKMLIQLYCCKRFGSLCVNKVMN